MGKIQGTNGEDFLGENDAIAETLSVSGFWLGEGIYRALRQE